MTSLPRRPCSPVTAILLAGILTASGCSWFRHPPQASEPATAAPETETAAPPPPAEPDEYGLRFSPLDRKRESAAYRERVHQRALAATGDQAWALRLANVHAEGVEAGASPREAAELIVLAIDLGIYEQDILTAVGRLAAGEDPARIRRDLRESR